MLPKEWALRQIEAARTRRDWSVLPRDYERDAVRGVFQVLRPHFCKRREIKQRIAASKAVTFTELEATL